MSHIPKNGKISLNFERFFITVELRYNLSFATTGIRERKEKWISEHLWTPKSKIQNISTSKCYVSLLINTKEMIGLSYCHKVEVIKVNRKLKIKGRNIQVSASYCFLHKLHMDWASYQRKVFDKLLTTAVVNTSVIYSEIHHKMNPLITFAIDLPKEMTSHHLSAFWIRWNNVRDYLNVEEVLQMCKIKQ